MTELDYALLEKLRDMKELYELTTKPIEYVITESDFTDLQNYLDHVINSTGGVASRYLQEVADRIYTVVNMRVVK